MQLENSGQLESSLDKIKKMNIKKFYPGHVEPFLIDEYLNAR